jgi:hypothetical protein
VCVCIESHGGGGGVNIRTGPDRPWGPPSLLYSGYRVSFPGIKWQERGANHPPPFRAEVKERIELYLYLDVMASSRASFTLYIYSQTSNNGHCRGIKILSVIGGVR